MPTDNYEDVGAFQHTDLELSSTTTNYQDIGAAQHKDGAADQLPTNYQSVQVGDGMAVGDRIR